ncbi:DUF3499 domain-containing protein [Stackebrandtia soli]
MATLTYVYNDSTAVVGPLSTTQEPHTYDLCEEHARKLTAPRGWELVRHVDDYATPMPSGDDLVALADAVREAAKSKPEPVPDVPPTPRRPGVPTGRVLTGEPAPSPARPLPTAPPLTGRSHLRVVGSEPTGDERPPRRD